MSKKKIKFIPHIIIGIMSVAAILYFYSSVLYSLGIYTDDSLFVCMAKSIINGHYRAIFSPLFEPVQTPMPGYPLLILPFVLIFNPTSIVLKLISIVFVLSAGIFLYLLLRREKYPEILCVMALGFFLLNGAVVPMSSQIMSEPAFLLLSLMGLYLLSMKGPKWLILSGLILGWAWLTRPQGLLLIVACSIGLFRRNKKEDLLLFMASSFGIYFLVSLIIGEKGSNTQSYSDLLLVNLSGQTSIGTYIRNLKAVLGVSFLKVFYHMPVIGYGWVRSVLAWSTILFSLGVICFGVWKQKKTSLIAESSLWFVGLTFLLLPFWFGIDIRYSLIILPFLIILVIPGIYSLVSRKRKKDLTFIILMVVIFLPNVSRNFRTLKNASAAYAENYEPIPVKSFQWIKNNIPEDRHILSTWAPTVYIYTNRKSLSYFNHETRAEFLEKLRRYKIDYIFRNERQLVHMPSSSKVLKTIRQVNSWINDDQKIFSKIYSNEIERAEVYKVNFSNEVNN